MHRWQKTNTPRGCQISRFLSFYCNYNNKFLGQRIVKSTICAIIMKMNFKDRWTNQRIQLWIYGILYIRILMYRNLKIIQFGNYRFLYRYKYNEVSSTLKKKPNCNYLFTIAHKIPQFSAIVSDILRITLYFGALDI